MNNYKINKYNVIYIYIYVSKKLKNIENFDSSSSSVSSKIELDHTAFIIFMIFLAVFLLIISIIAGYKIEEGWGFVIFVSFSFLFILYHTYMNEAERKEDVEEGWKSVGFAVLIIFSVIFVFFALLTLSVEKYEVEESASTAGAAQQAAKEAAEEAAKNALL